MDDKIVLFERTPIPTAVAKLSLPTIFSSLVMVLYNLVDTYFVGMLNDPVESAAVTLVAPVLLAFNAVNNLFGVGTSSMMSRGLGRHDYETVSLCSVMGFYCTVFCAVVFSVLCGIWGDPLLRLLGADAVTKSAAMEYMRWTVICGAVPAILNVVLAYMVRSEGASLHASIGTMSGCFLNMILDPVFILGLNMGAAGAGLATFLSNCAACLYFFILIYQKRENTVVCISPRKLRFDGQILMGICAVGVPASIQNLLNVTGMTILNNFTAAYGADAVAAMGIAHKVNMVPMQIAMGFSQGIMPLVSYTFSSKNRKRMKEAILFAVKLMIPVLVLIALLYYIWAGELTHLFMENESIVAYGQRFLRGYCLGLPFLCLDFLAVGVFQALGLGKNALVFAIMRKIVLEIPALFLLNTLFPLYGLAYAQPIAELILSIAAVFLLKRILDSNSDGLDKA